MPLPSDAARTGPLAKNESNVSMSIRLALSCNPMRQNRLTPATCRKLRRLGADNDNGPQFEENVIVQETLRHFSQHGLSASRYARQMAEAAALRGDDEAFAWWREIGGALDRRIAGTLNSATGTAKS